MLVAADGQGAGDDFGPGVGRLEDHPAAHVQLAPGVGDEDGLHAGHGAFAVQGDGGIHLHRFYRPQQDVVGDVGAAFLHHDRGAGAHMDLFAPVVDHGEGELAALLDIEFRDPDVQAGNDPGVGGAAGDDVERGPLLHHHQVVHVLGKPVGAQVEAGLHRLGDLSPREGPDEITVVQLQFGGGGVFVGIHRHQAPEEVFDPVVAAARLR